MIMRRRSGRNIAYTLLGVGAWGLLSLFFALESGQIRRRGPDIFADTDPLAFRNRIAIYAFLGICGVALGLLALVWQWLRGDGLPGSTNPYSNAGGDTEGDRH
jgi:hypothetical protein